jgi:hypothetical protein
MPDWYLVSRSLAESTPAQTEVPTIIGTKRLMFVTAASHPQPTTRPTANKIAIHVFIGV